MNPAYIPLHLPAQSGALNGHLMTDAEIAAHDAMIWADDLARYRNGPRKVSLVPELPPRFIN
jgi:hypothetical protein